MDVKKGGRLDWWPLSRMVVKKGGALPYMNKYVNYFSFHISLQQMITRSQTQVE